MTLNIDIQVIVFFGSLILFTFIGTAIASIIILHMFPNGTDIAFLVSFLGSFGGALLGVYIWLHIIQDIMNYLF